MSPLDALERLRDAIDLPEATAVTALGAPPDAAVRERGLALARSLVEGARGRADERSYLDAFLQEFGLSNQEGIALMCLAEALLRIPDAATADRLIAEKLRAGDWAAHAGRSESLFVNASTWALMLTGQLVDVPDNWRADVVGWLRGFTLRLGEPLVRQALRRGMQIIGGEFVVGAGIDAALRRCAQDAALALCSFDMLGEGARSDSQALGYLASYHAAIRAVARANAARASAPVHARHGVSIKLSALDPRYALRHADDVHRRLLPRVRELVRAAAAHDLPVTIDAEEADRLELSLEIFEALVRDPSTRDWAGLGLAVQAYACRAPRVIDWLTALAEESGRRLAVRLVKGAYWDSEIKRAQERGLAAYPVYTRKVITDVAYLACTERLFAARTWIYPQFATHNAHTLAAVLALRPAGAALEFQRLHGMGQLLDAEAARQVPELPPVRVYAPVGRHADLLAYLVRRLLENGANTSFVNRFMDQSVPVPELVRDPWEELAGCATVAHSAIALPPDLYGAERRNSRGIDPGSRRVLEQLAAQLAAGRDARPAATPLVAGERHGGEVRLALNPADTRDVVGRFRYAAAADVARAFEHASCAQPAWNAAGAGHRAACLERAADAIEEARATLLPLLVREAGKTVADAIAEIREAADFCRYYAAEARRQFAAPLRLAGPTGETNELSLAGRGAFACISPWNFPLAIFTGQVAAALAAGNTVLAKPAESTCLIGMAAVELLHAAGIPSGVLHYLPMTGSAFGAAALGDPRLAGVVFTGSTRTAQTLARALAARDGAILPLIAETGGINAMIVDSTALLEQVVDDVIASAFGSAGQRCSALRLLCVQQDIAGELIALIEAAMDELQVGDPAVLATDVGPVISAAAAGELLQHVEDMRRRAHVRKARALDARHAHGSFVAPHLIELERPQQLEREVFGPLLHVVRYRADALDGLLAGINASGYALTLGVQTRIESFWREIFRSTATGNTYINRNMIGAVVGVQPFGGSGLSGTGPKAGGPHYLPRFASERTLTVNTTATGGNAQLLGLAP
ncbi:MAG: bifunctional proline dehydrogenase/L-glutamate gamma-semialdehyde dehydrogenase PutA [Gammaproteobacteria bacterium]|nr:bifunctional proline dehydrogenase/L-glutamate gamma-semialdehyde dehydrogenase PutA [Gammaproteobacteria bacterium]